MNERYPYLSVSPGKYEHIFKLTLHLGTGIIERNPSHSIEICQLAMLSDPSRITGILRKFADELDVQLLPLKATEASTVTNPSPSNPEVGSLSSSDIKVPTRGSCEGGKGIL